MGCFLDYKMIDSKIVASQVHELQVLLHEIHAKGMVLIVASQVHELQVLLHEIHAEGMVLSETF